jgi:hypothetical protein
VPCSGGAIRTVPGAGGVAARVGRVLGFVLIALGFLELVAGSFLGLWVAFVGWFIVAAATAEGQLDQIEGLTGLRVGDVTEPAPTVLAEWWTVEQVLAQASPDHPVARAFPLVDFAGRPPVLSRCATWNGSRSGDERKHGCATQFVAAVDSRCLPDRRRC